MPNKKGEHLVGFLSTLCEKPASDGNGDDIIEAALRAWLSHIEETDADIIEHVIAKCRLDEDVRDYFLRRALEQRGAAPKPAPVFGEPDEA
jgi:tRNA splicing endonuclease